MVRVVAMEMRALKLIHAKVELVQEVIQSLAQPQINVTQPEVVTLRMASVQIPMQPMV